MKRLGMSDVERVTLSGDPSVGGITDCLRFPRCGDFHPLRYLDGLAAAVVRLGGVIHEGTLMTSYDASGKVTTSTGRHARTGWPVAC